MATHVKQVRISRATGPPNAPLTKILIDGELPIGPHTELGEMRSIYESEAERLEEALCGSLPGGTYDALIIKMLDRTRSLFVVPHRVKKEEK